MPVSAARPVGANGQRTKEGPAAAGGVEPQALPVTHWFEADNDGEPYSATVRFRGRRIGIRGTSKPQDAFVKDETIDGIMPGSGRVSISTWVYGVAAGEWTVSADLIRRTNTAGQPLADHWARVGAPQLPRAAWSWRRWALSAGRDIPVKTWWAPLVRLAVVPAVVRGSWFVLVTVGILAGAMTQGAILRPQNISVGRALIVDIVAVVSGVIGAKLWLVVVQGHSWRQSISEGWSINGSILAAPAMAVASLVALDMPIGTFFDASAPGLFLGIAIGRLGCFLTGCCAGRCTRSRWGIWSSDRRVGARRIPAQLLESASGIMIGAASAWLVLGYAPRFPGAIFLAAGGSYVLVRQLLLRLRAEARPVSRGARLTTAGAGLVLLVAAIVLVFGSTS